MAGDSKPDDDGWYSVRGMGIGPLKERSSLIYEGTVQNTRPQEDRKRSRKTRPQIR